MGFHTSIMKFVQQEDVNFLLTNRLPRRLATRFIGWFSRIEHPLVRDLSLKAWTYFADLDLSEAKQTRFRSMHDCFTRELKPGARPIDPDPAVLASPCDGIIGACGTVDGGEDQLQGGKGCPIRSTICSPTPSMRQRSAKVSTSRCGSLRACTTVFTRRTT